VYFKGNEVRVLCEPVTVIGDKPVKTTGCSREGTGENNPKARKLWYTENIKK
jgi:hypothetical protein